MLVSDILCLIVFLLSVWWVQPAYANLGEVWGGAN
jgi:hypothetical protein